MPGLRQLALALICTIGAGIAASPALAKQPKAASAQQARTKALIAFQRDLVSVLAPRADALPLLGAALLARPLPEQPKWNDFHSLIERAVAAPGHGPAERWVQLADCDAKADACPNADALAALVAQTPDNAAVWLLKLGQDLHNGKHDDARTDLAQAARAKLYDDYTGTSLQALAHGVSTLPPPEATLDPQAGAGAAGVQAMIVFGIAGAQPQPGLQATAELCEAAGEDQALAADCRQLGKTLEWASSPLARSLGLHLREVLAADEGEREHAQRERRDLVWQVQQFTRLAAKAQADRAQAQHLLSLARHGGTEMSLMLAALRDAGVSITAPADWTPHSAKNGETRTGSAERTRR
ncbi:hypothetical protein J7I44_11865 [Frateuria sp. MAH-13]|uniref:Secreted protein n=1 Tax=Frateuria flava TaxID=2821489 RepID=A0ABS4DPK5_9GAMM|nr:hypothetical protein [Frateuria flava]MBP1474999.1 hypothetical protein [Frateuria flava]